MNVAATVKQLSRKNFGGVRATGAEDLGWTKSASGSYAVQSIQFDNAAWSAVSSISTAATYCSEASLAWNGSGKALAAWDQDNRIMAASFRNDAWEAAVPLNESGVTASSSPSLATDGSGLAIAVWAQPEAGNSTIWATHTEPDGHWQAAKEIVAAASSQAIDPKVAIAKGVGAFVTWKRRDLAQGFNDRASVVASADFTAWGSVESLQTDGDVAQSFFPVVAADASGKAVAAWREDTGIFVSRFAFGKWSKSEALAKGSVGFPEVAMDGSGKAIVVWAMQDEQNKLRVYVSELR